MKILEQPASTQNLGSYKKRFWKALGFKMRATIILLNEWVRDPNFLKACG